MNLKYKANILLVMLIIFSTLYAKTAQSQSFVKVDNGQFAIEGKPYYFMGTNFWYGAILGADTEDGDRDRLLKELDFMKKIGITNLRVMIGAEGPEDDVHRVQPSLQKMPGEYDEKLLEGLDFLLNEMSKRNMYAILFLTNSWDWSGGYGQYLEWNGYGEAICIREGGNDWNKYQAFNGQFHTCEPCVEQYHNHIKFILSRTNSISGKKYIDEPAIMAWEVGNEPRAFGVKNIPAFEKMIAGTAQLIKSIDQNHLVTTGTEGEMGCEGKMDLFERIHSDSNIDYLTMHIWPFNWGWIKGDDIAGTIDGALDKANVYMDRHIVIAEKLNKPIVMEEFGLNRDANNFDRTGETVFRDQFYKIVFDKVEEHAKVKGKLAGNNFWSWGGFGIPAEGADWYTRGDDYMGDPPCEEQGVNSVFSTDKTIRLIKEYSKRLN